MIRRSPDRWARTLSCLRMLERLAWANVYLDSPRRLHYTDDAQRCDARLDRLIRMLDREADRLTLELLERDRVQHQSKVKRA